MFVKDQVVKIQKGQNHPYVQVESGPFKFVNSPEDSYQGWILLEKHHNPCSETLSVCFKEIDAILASEEEIATMTQGRINFHESSF
jgi:hypothetical protein